MRPPTPGPSQPPQLRSLGKVRPPMHMRASTMQMPSLANTQLRQPPMRGRQTLPSRAVILPKLPQMGGAGSVGSMGNVGSGGRLSAAARRALPDSSFAGPNRTFPIPDKGHAIAAKGMIGNAPPSARPKIKAKADAKLGKSAKSETKKVGKGSGGKGCK